MNKESAYEMGLQDGTGALQGAFSPCTAAASALCAALLSLLCVVGWRWFGEIRVPNHEWTHVAMAYDGTSELHYVHGVHQETDPCGDPGGSMTASQYPLRIGAREAEETSYCDSGEGCSAFQGDIDEIMLFDRALSELEISGLQSANYRTGGGMINVYAAGDADPSRLPDGCVGFWPLDGNPTDLVGGNGGSRSGYGGRGDTHTHISGEEWVKGLFGLAFRLDGDDSFRVTRCNSASAAEPWNLDVTLLTMLAWVRPQSYDPAYEARQAVIMNKENTWEFGLEEETGAVIGALSPCWRWW